MTVYVQLNEDGTVWCVAREDPGRDFGSSFGFNTASQVRVNHEAPSLALGFRV